MRIAGRIYDRNVILLTICICLFLCGCGMTKNAPLEDGNYVANVTMTGGSGRASVNSQSRITVKDGTIYATIEWSSPNYDYMIVAKEKYLNEATKGNNSVFTFPIEGFDTTIPVIGDTTAMSVPHEIEYVLTFSLTDVNYTDIVWNEETEVSYATQYSVLENDEYALITIVDSGRFLLVKEGEVVPVNVPNDIVILKAPLNNIYIVSSSVVDLIRQLNALDSIKMIGIKPENLYIDEAREAIDKGLIMYAGKYSSPDYELLINNGCDLAIENTMIYHNPQVREKLEELGINVFIEKSSYESHPLGRLEWIKLYGLLLNKEVEAKEFFDSEVDRIKPLITDKKAGLKVAYFSVNSNGMINVHKPGDYIVNMIELTGGKYALNDIEVEEDNALSTMNITKEDFYVYAKDADILIYNSTIEGELKTLDDLVKKDAIFSDFKAVSTGRAYSTSKDFFQESTGLGRFMEDLAGIYSDDNSKLNYLTKLE